MALRAGARGSVLVQFVGKSAASRWVQSLRRRVCYCEWVRTRMRAVALEYLHFMLTIPYSHQPAHQPVHHPIHRSSIIQFINRSINRSIIQLIVQSINRSINQFINQFISAGAFGLFMGVGSWIRCEDSEADLGHLCLAADAAVLDHRLSLALPPSSSAAVAVVAATRAVVCPE